jgi:hypothetical protein
VSLAACHWQKNKRMHTRMKPLTLHTNHPPGRWKKTEHDEFLRGMELHGKVNRLCPDTQWKQGPRMPILQNCCPYPDQTTLTSPCAPHHTHIRTSMCTHTLPLLKP